MYSEADLRDSMDKIETINFHEQKTFSGIKFWCYHAGDADDVIDAIRASRFVIRSRAWSCDVYVRDCWCPCPLHRRLLPRRRSPLDGSRDPCSETGCLDHCKI